MHFNAIGSGEMIPPTQDNIATIHGVSELRSGVRVKKMKDSLSSLASFVISLAQRFDGNTCLWFGLRYTY